jgi:hypothetical protein
MRKVRLIEKQNTVIVRSTLEPISQHLLRVFATM